MSGVVAYVVRWSVAGAREYWQRGDCDKSWGPQKSARYLFDEAQADELTRFANDGRSMVAFGLVAVCVKLVLEGEVE